MCVFNSFVSSYVYRDIDKRKNLRCRDRLGDYLFFRKIRQVTRSRLINILHLAESNIRVLANMLWLIFNSPPCWLMCGTLSCTSCVLAEVFCTRTFWTAILGLRLIRTILYTIKCNARLLACGVESQSWLVSISSQRAVSKSLMWLCALPCRAQWSGLWLMCIIW